MQLNNNVSTRNSVTPTNTSRNTTTTEDFGEGAGDSELTQEDFLHLLITQLQNQDPLSPMESNDFTMQTTAFSQLGEMVAMNKSIGSLADALMQQSNNNSSLLQGSSFLGKEIEYSTNTVTFDGSPVTNFNFYLGGTPDMSKSEIRIYNEKGELVSTFKPDEMVSGQNKISWDGVGENGVQLPEGTYFFEVSAVTVEGAPVTFEAFGSGIVESVKMANGVLFFGIDGGVVSSEHVYSVRDPKPTDPTPDPDPDNPDPDIPDPDNPDPDIPDPDNPDPAPDPEVPDTPGTS